MRLHRGRLESSIVGTVIFSSRMAHELNTWWPQCFRNLYSLNCHTQTQAFIWIGHRLEYSDTVHEVRFFVLVREKSTSTFSPARLNGPSELGKLIISPSSWKLLLDRESDKAWLVCVSHVLQVRRITLVISLVHQIIDDTSMGPFCRRCAYRCLRELARESISPPSTTAGYAIQGVLSTYGGSRSVFDYS
jgi:hypothetical protein